MSCKFTLNDPYPTHTPIKFIQTVPLNSTFQQPYSLRQWEQKLPQANRPCSAVSAWRSLHINIYARQRHQMTSCAVQPVWQTDTHPSSWALACLSWLWPWPCHPLLQKADGSDGPWCPSQRWCTGSWHLEYRIEDQHEKGATVGEGEVKFKWGQKLLNTDVHTWTNYSALCHLTSPSSLPTSFYNKNVYIYTIVLHH